MGDEACPQVPSPALIYRSTAARGDRRDTSLQGKRQWLRPRLLLMTSQNLSHTSTLPKTWLSVPIVKRLKAPPLLSGNESGAATIKSHKSIMNRSARQESRAWSPYRRQEQRGGRPHTLEAIEHRVGSRTGDSFAGSSPSHHKIARSKRHLEGVLRKYTNLLQGWQSRYFVLDPEVGQLQYYLNVLSKSQRPPRGSLPLLGAMVVSSDEFPFMFTFQSTTGDFYKLRALDAQEQDLWMTQLQLCSRRQSDSNVKTSNPDTLDPNDETTDTEDNEEEDLGVLDGERSIIIHLLSQLKLGMDLTRVVLPTFILEKRSLLEMYANFIAHPDMFLSITSGCTPEERIIRFVEYYLTAFNEGRKGAVAKKPYNPILGENFHCSWYVPRDCVRPLRTTNCTGPNSAPTATSNIPVTSQRGMDGSSRRNSDYYCVRFVAEQVSHHPPVSGFYCECKEKRMCVNTHVWTKSKFMGMSVGVSMVGEGVLYLLEHDEEYVFTLPCAYARSILTVPWVELGGKVTIDCAKSGYSATVTFHTKPFYGGKVHRVTAEVKHNQTGNIVCKGQGEWNGMLEFTYNNGENKVIDTSKLPIIKKKIRPLEKQGLYESRRLWQHVTASLKAGNMDAATEHKHCLEERQRSEGKQRASTKIPWKARYFIKEGEGWVYHKPLWKAD
ncbi:oxysterol-binding protein-related protein 10-like [Xiphias gladius]|uniref:oxysterol-binding protein-related protein 10-like n=1 Tax=Xiphias gladius TaxID=8245 RepID=UPI001A97ED94|nr:oxysterol-binding protein-related protein 10-like [Xiphias gladius]